MDIWEVVYTKEAQEDLSKFDRTTQLKVLKAITKVRQNPLASTEGGYGKPLGNSKIALLTGLMKIKIKNPSIRIVYQLVREKEVMKIIIIAARSDDFVYRETAKRIKKK